MPGPTTPNFWLGAVPNSITQPLPDPYVMGSEFQLTIVVTAVAPSPLPDFAADSVTLVFDAPPAYGGTGATYPYRWRPLATSDTQFTYAAPVLTFTLTSAQATALLTPGDWRIGLLWRNPATNQDVVGIMILTVVQGGNTINYPVA